MKFTSIFFTASAAIFLIYHKDSNKRARNMKFTSIFFTASAAIFLTCHKKVRNFSEINTLHGAIFLLYISIRPTNGHGFTQIFFIIN